MQKLLRILTFSLCVGGISMPLSAQETEPLNAKSVVATVNGEEITIGHMIAARASLPERFTQVDPQELYNGILQQLIQQTALAQETETLPPLVALTLENKERALKASASIDRAMKAAVTEADIEAAYDAQYGSLDPQEEFNASHILVESEEDALAVVEALAGGANFAATAREKSNGPSGPNGGELGWFGAGEMVPNFEAATVALEIGEVSQPVQTQFGWHVIQLNDTRKAEIPTLEDVRTQITSILSSDAAVIIVQNAGVEAQVDIPEYESLDPAILFQQELLDQ